MYCVVVQNFEYETMTTQLYLTLLQCRQSTMSDRKSMTADLCLQWSGGGVVRHTLNFGRMPIMVKVFSGLFRSLCCCCFYQLWRNE
jgi:hypothetical protein